MKTKSILLIFLIFAPFLLYSQDFETDKVAQEAMAKLSFMEGNWEGEGWKMGADRLKSNFEQTEEISFQTDGVTLLIFGKGKKEGKLIHNAMAIVSYDKEEENYNFQSYLANGRKGEFKADLKDGKFHWYPSDNMRYIIGINEKGQWFETGEINMNETWYQFFEMTLDKK